MQGGRKGLLQLLQLLAALRALVGATFGVFLGTELVKAGVGHSLPDQGLLRRQRRARSQVRRA